MKLIISIFTIISIITTTSAYCQEVHWYKGNTHTHTTNSDGNETPRRVVRWYLDHNYNFLVLSDHSYLNDIKYLDTDKNDDFTLIPGEEVTDRAEHKPVHLIAMGIKNLVKEQHGKTILETLQNDIDAINAAGGIAQINHPNWKYSFNDTTLSQVRNVKLVEIYNISTENNNYSAGGYPGMEEIWDKVLSAGVMMYGVISDDTHDYLGEFSADKSPPGRGWIMVRANELTAEAIIASLEKGDFYATVGVILNDIKITDKTYSIDIQPFGDAKFTTLFIGRNGKVLKEDYNLKSSYTFSGDEGYVRIKVLCSSGDFAITQPMFVK
jgi:hypothetical protein